MKSALVDENGQIWSPDSDALWRHLGLPELNESIVDLALGNFGCVYVNGSFGSVTIFIESERISPACMEATRGLIAAEQPDEVVLVITSGSRRQVTSGERSVLETLQSLARSAPGSIAPLVRVGSEVDLEMPDASEANAHSS